MSKHPFKNGGLTMIELMITLAIAAILIASAAPSFRTSIQNNRLVTQVNELHTALSIARSEAIKRSTNITVCVLDDENRCEANGDWHDGWTTFVDSNANGQFESGAPENDEILRTDSLISAGNTLSFSQTRVIYGWDGFAEPNSNGTFTLCDSRGASEARGLVVGLSGRPSLSQDSDSNGILEDGDDNDLVCPS